MLDELKRLGGRELGEGVKGNFFQTASFTKEKLGYSAQVTVGEKTGLLRKLVLNDPLFFCRFP